MVGLFLFPGHHTGKEPLYSLKIKTETQEAKPTPMVIYI